MINATGNTRTPSVSSVAPARSIGTRVRSATYDDANHNGSAIVAPTNRAARTTKGSSLRLGFMPRQVSRSVPRRVCGCARLEDARRTREQRYARTPPLYGEFYVGRCDMPARIVVRHVHRIEHDVRTSVAFEPQLRRRRALRPRFCCILDSCGCY